MDKYSLPISKSTWSNSITNASQVMSYRDSTLFFSDIYVGHTSRACLEKQCYESQRVALALPQGTKRLVQKFWYTNKTIEVRLGASKVVGVTEYAEKTKYIMYLIRHDETFGYKRKS
jgi:hypothetical protein